MRTLAMALAIAAPAALPLHAQDVDTMACAAFRAMTTDQQVQALSTIEPFGDVMEASDRGASEQWAATVNDACAVHPDRRVVDVARAAAGGD